ncbi:hypothetical protein TWF718_000491 [Orbilia javanica]|uniref:DUF6697 domain-containing protein n=1 Tax=Orbilia javanica TaxID=47235 RepID=A0AAN8RRP0_9PEZI
MTRVAFLRNSNSRPPSLLTEPLTTKEWTAFGTAVGESSQEERLPEHLRFHNPAWDLSLLRTLAQKRWEQQGREGELEEPDPIDTFVESESEGADMVDEMDLSISHETSYARIEAANILLEGRMRKKAKLDYSGMFLPFKELDDEGRGSPHRSAVESTGGDNTSSQLFLGSDSGLHSLPKLHRKRRGRRSRKAQDASELGSEVGDLPQSEDNYQGSASPDMAPLADPVSKIQKERRKTLIEAGNKVPETGLFKPSPGIKDKVYATPPPLANGRVLHSGNGKSFTGYRKRVSLARGLCDSEDPVITSSISRPTQLMTSPDGEVIHKLSDFPTPPPLSAKEGNDSSPTSSDYDSIFSDDQDTTFPAGQLRLADLSPEIVASIPKPLEYFSRRDHVGPVIGGNNRVLIATTAARPNAPIQTRGYMGIQPAWNPHAPKKAGENGSIMQLSSTSTDPISKTQENFPLFVARAPHQWEYCGQYQVAKIVKLSAFENWMHLSTGGSKLLKYWGEEILQKRFEWAKNLFMQNCGWTEEKWLEATVEDIMGHIMTGTVPMHWVHLQCVGFDLVFYEALLRQKVKCGLVASEKIIL